MNAQKYLIGLLFVISCTITYAQEFREGHIKKLENLGIQYKTEYSASEQTTKDLHQILKYESKRKAQNKIGGVLFTVGLVGLISGALLSTKEYKDSAYFTIDDQAIVVGAALTLGSSIPLLIGSGKNKKRRDKLKMKYLEDSVDNTSIRQTNFLSEN